MVESIDPIAIVVFEHLSVVSFSVRLSREACTIYIVYVYYINIHIVQHTTTLPDKTNTQHCPIKLVSFSVRVSRDGARRAELMSQVSLAAA